MTALPALTLLECGVPGSDPQIQKAASLIRSRASQVHATYELSLAILFLDRLGETRDQDLIRSFALRLVAGQVATGGWSYQCPALTPKEEQLLLTALQEMKPTSPMELFVPGGEGKMPDRLGQGAGEPPTPEGKPQQPGRPGPSRAALPLPNDPERGTRAWQGPSGRENSPGLSESARKALQALPPRLRPVPAVQALAPTANPGIAGLSQSDNSNTQFAILGLWAAGRHDLPLERALALIVRRFRTSQNGDGGWGYHYQAGNVHTTPAMTAAGLLGLAVGHGLTIAKPGGPAPKETIQDPAIDRGLETLSKQISKRQGANRRVRLNINLYLLWSLERVCVIYNLRTISNKDWYTWGAELLLDHQEDDGRWQTGVYYGSTPITDTCFALLFLKRANLAKDLSEKLEFFIQGKDRSGR
jgi:hypothetical protein